MSMLRILQLSNSTAAGVVPADPDTSIAPATTDAPQPCLTTQPEPCFPPPPANVDWSDGATEEVPSVTSGGILAFIVLGFIIGVVVLFIVYRCLRSRPGQQGTVLDEVTKGGQEECDQDVCAECHGSYFVYLITCPILLVLFLQRRCCCCGGTTSTGHKTASAPTIPAHKQKPSSYIPEPEEEYDLEMGGGYYNDYNNHDYNSVPHSQDPQQDPAMEEAEEEIIEFVYMEQELQNKLPELSRLHDSMGDDPPGEVIDQSALYLDRYHPAINQEQQALVMADPQQRHEEPQEPVYYEEEEVMDELVFDEEVVFEEEEASHEEEILNEEEALHDEDVVHEEEEVIMQEEPPSLSTTAMSHAEQPTREFGTTSSPSMSTALLPQQYAIDETSTVNANPSMSTAALPQQSTDEASTEDAYPSTATLPLQPTEDTSTVDGRITTAATDDAIATTDDSARLSATVASDEAIVAADDSLVVVPRQRVQLEPPEEAVEHFLEPEEEEEEDVLLEEEEEEVMEEEVVEEEEVMEPMEDFSLNMRVVDNVSDYQTKDNTFGEEEVEEEIIEEYIVEDQSVTEEEVVYDEEEEYSEEEFVEDVAQ